MSSEVVLVVFVYVNSGMEAEFRRFETEAARVIRKYGGKIERVIRPLDSAGQEPPPHEVHVVTFPSLDRFESYREDPELADLAPLRLSAIARTEITVGRDGEPY